jgi:hypothetical protein
MKEIEQSNGDPRILGAWTYTTTCFILHTNISQPKLRSYTVEQKSCEGEVSKCQNYVVAIGRGNTAATQ